MSRIKTLALSALLAATCPWPGLASLAAAAPEAEVRVDLAHRLGPVPPVLHPGLWVSVDQPAWPYAREIAARDLRLAAVDINIERVLLASTGLEDVARRLAEDTEFTAWAQVARAQAARFIVTIVKMPRWLAANTSEHAQALSEFPTFSVSPPRDYGLWERLVETVVNHFSRRLGVKTAYAIWNEPDIYSWEGTDRDYLELYRRAAQAVKRVDPNALVGGPAVSELLGPKKPPELATHAGPFLEQFLRAAGGMRLPLDFIVWHEFNALPAAYAWKAETVRRWLRAAGYPATTPLWVLDWNGWQHFDTNNPVYRWGSADRDTEVNAAYTVATVAEMHAAGVGLQTFGSLEEMDQGMFNSPSQFVGGFGAVTRNYVVKPVYHAFQMLDRLDGVLTAAETADPILTVLAASGSRGHTVLLSNFIPTEQMLKEDMQRRAQTLGITGPVLREQGLSPDVALEIATGRIPVEDPRVPVAIRARLARLRDAIAPEVPLARAVPGRRNTPVNVTIRWEGLEAGPWRLERYVIDSTHGNSFARRQEVEDRLRRLGSDVRTQVLKRLRGEGASEAQLRELQRLAEERARAAGLPPEIQRWANRALELSREIRGKFLDALNRAPGIGLDLMDTRSLSPGVHHVRVEMPPDSVALLLLRRGE